MTRRVVITGIGVVTAAGSTPGALWDACATGRSPIRPVFDNRGYAAEIAGWEWTSARAPMASMDRFMQFALAAADAAVDDARLPLGAIRETCGVCIGSALAGQQTMESQHQTLRERGPSRVRPLFIPKMLASMAGSCVSVMHGLRGPTMGLMCGAASGLCAIGQGLRWIRRGRADCVIAGGAEAPVTPLTFAALADCLSPSGVPRPFASDRDGIVLGEGAAVVVLEERTNALARGATIYAEVGGFASRGGDDIPSVLAAALADAAIPAAAVDYVNASADGGSRDAAEAAALHAAFGDRPLLVSTRGTTGHLLGASGPVETVVCIEAMRSASRRIRVALNDAFGPGLDAALVLTQPELRA